MGDKKELSKKELIARAEELGFFKKKGIKVMFARSNGSFYYTSPPRFIDDFTTHKITREDVEGKADKGNKGGNDVVYPLNAKDTAALINKADSVEALEALLTDGKLVVNDVRKTVIEALKKRNEELSS